MQSAYRNEMARWCREYSDPVLAQSSHCPESTYLAYLQGANIYVAGSATKLAQSVLTALELLVAEAAPMPKAAAQKYVRQLESGRRYFVEAW